jgi:hypothetical protein
MARRPGTIVAERCARSSLAERWFPKLIGPLIEWVSIGVGACFGAKEITKLLHRRDDPGGLDDANSTPTI